MDVDEYKISHAIRLVFDTQRLELYQKMTGRRPGDREFAEFISDSIFILEIFLNGLKKQSSI
jgi:hypothetical protein